MNKAKRCRRARVRSRNDDAGNKEKVTLVQSRRVSGIRLAIGYILCDTAPFALGTIDSYNKLLAFDEKLQRYQVVTMGHTVGKLTTKLLCY